MYGLVIQNEGNMTSIITPNTTTEVQVHTTDVVQVSVRRNGTLARKTGRNLESAPASTTALRNKLLLSTARNSPLKILDDRGRVILAAAREITDGLEPPSLIWESKRWGSRSSVSCSWRNC